MVAFLTDSMKKTARKLVKNSLRSMSVMAPLLIVVLGTSAGVSTDDANAKKLLKGMPDYLSAQKALSFDYDATLEVRLG